MDGSINQRPSSQNIFYITLQNINKQCFISPLCHICMIKRPFYSGLPEIYRILIQNFFSSLFGHGKHSKNINLQLLRTCLLWEHVNKKLAFLTSASAKAFPPPLAVSGHSDLFKFFLLQCIKIYIYVFELERPEMDECERKKSQCKEMQVCLFTCSLFLPAFISFPRNPKRSQESFSSWIE